MQALVSSLIC